MKIEYLGFIPFIIFLFVVGWFVGMINDDYKIGVYFMSFMFLIFLSIFGIVWALS